MVETKPQKDTRQPLASVKDTIKDKADKLCSAMYLVTNFLADSDQIKWRLRTKALDLKDNLTLGVKETPTPSVSVVVPVEIILSHIREILSLIDIAVLDCRASVMNFTILRDGYRSLQQEFQNYVAGDWYKNFLQLPIATKTINLSPQISPKINSGDNRREKILSFIKQHNWSSIKEIAQFIPGVSSKTVQRELAELVRAGALKKTGERRWSSYGIAV
ncbi:MAG: DeoR family transcriptional regulator [Candidatus Vogelbacteria bacterium]